MNKFFIIAIVVTILIMIGGAFALSGNQSGEAPPLFDGYEYFWGDGCPHCAKVAEFFSNWENYDKITISKKEVWNNPNDARLMNQRANACGIPAGDVGVPLLVTPDGKCFIGDGPVIDYFSNLKFDDSGSEENSTQDSTSSAIIKPDISYNF